MVIDEHENKLLIKFNKRDSNAFETIYSVYYNELLYYAVNLYRNTEIDPSDAIQDVFLSLWQSDTTKFDELINIKAYLFVAIRNNFRTYISHAKHKDKYSQYQLSENQMFQIDVIESEVFSNLHQILNLLPQDSAKILELFITGYNIDEIAEKLGKTKRTIYNKKSEAIHYLKKKITHNNLLTLLIIIS